MKLSIRPPKPVSPKPEPEPELEVEVWLEHDGNDINVRASRKDQTDSGGRLVKISPKGVRRWARINLDLGFPKDTTGCIPDLPTAP